MRRRIIALAALFAGAALPGAAGAQQEFTQQGLLITAFEGRDFKLGRALADELRSRVQRLHDKKSLLVISGREVSDALYQSGFDESIAPDGGVIRTIAQRFRADEWLRATATRTPQGIRVESRLVLRRDERLSQPLPVAVGGDVDAVAGQLAASIRDARRQLAPQRRCENAAREGDTPRALAAAREGIAAYPRSTLARTCLLGAMIQAGTPADEVLKEAQTVLSIAPGSFWALDASARSYDALRDRPKAAAMWLAVAATDSADTTLAARVIQALADGGNARAAESLVVRASDANPENITLLRLRWRVLSTNQNWAPATVAGARLLVVDTLAQQDSSFHLRLADAYRANEEPFKAVATVANAMTRFPGDGRLYLLYTQLVREESAVALDRGLEKFPQLAELHVLRSQELKRSGKSAEAIEASKRALALDSTLTHGYLQLAQSQSELGQHDSAFVTLRRALDAGEDTAVVAQQALARGNQLFRAANGSKTRDDFVLAMRFLAMADSLRPSPQSRFLLGATALAITQSAATDAPRTRSCELARQASELLPLALEKITAGAEMAPDAARQYLTYLDQLDDVVAQQLTALCTEL